VGGGCLEEVEDVAELVTQRLGAEHVGSLGACDLAWACASLDRPHPWWCARTRTRDAVADCGLRTTRVRFMYGVGHMVLCSFVLR
jgi:hypothetical protein